ncbi:MAG TPA: type II toxin-antitoxin system death-on-curing family toxin [Ruthenibacterium lactatiformans]|nr:type II toxin-antitoxin system death-on-curing family toxin [Ruthenibacterium lactatiformans]
MKKLSKRQVVMLHEQMIRETGGLSGIRDAGLLESALESPFQEFDGTSVYPSVQQKAARLGFGLVKNHPFVDGNKRIGAHVMLVFLELNGIVLDYTSEELSEIILKLAAGDSDLQSLLSWILEHQV